MRQGQGRLEEPDLGRHQTLGAVAEADQQAVTRLQLGDTIPAQRLHVDEDVVRTIAARHEAEAAVAVSPLPDGALEAPGWGHLHMCAPRPLRRVHGRRFVHGGNAKNLHPLQANGGFADDPRTFVRRLEAVATKRRDVKKNVGSTTVLGDEAVTFGNIKPFDPTCDFDEMQAFASIVGGLDVAVI